ncbi:MAG: carbohydrate binding domain-containing protein, partial [Armatimonadota bacterium]
MTARRLIRFAPPAALVGTLLLLARVTPPVAAQETMLVSSFETQADLAKWRVEGEAELTTEHATEGKRALHLTFSSGSGRMYAEGALPADWSAWGLLKVDAFNPGPQFSVTVRVDDTDGKPMSQWYMPLRTGLSTQDVLIRCLAEGVNVKSIARVEIRVAPRLQRPVEFYLDNLRFTKAEQMTTYEPPRLPEARPPLAAEESLVANPDFEFGLQDWGSWGQWDGGRYVFGSGTGEDAYSGKRSAAVICNKVGRGGIWSAAIAVPQEAEYKLTFWAKGSEPTALRSGIEGGGAERLSPRTDIGTEWSEHTFTAKLPAGISVSVYLYSVGPGTVYFDRVKLEREGALVSIPKPQYATMTPSRLECRGDVTYLDGKPWYAIGIYHGVAGELTGTGFNCIPGWDEGASLQDCLKAGILKLPDLTGLLRAHVPESVADRIRAVKNHPAVGAWYVCDEPDHAQWNVAPDEVRYATDALHKEDPNHPTVCVVMAWAESNIYRYAHAVD